MQHVAAIAARLPSGSSMINLCEDRYLFIAAYAAALSREHTVLLPSSRAESIVREVELAHAGSYRCSDDEVLATLDSRGGDTSDPATTVASDSIFMVGFTSGSTGQPKAFPKLWRSVTGSNANNVAAARRELPLPDSIAWIVATVPPQHMYGLELSVLMPMIGGMAVHSGRPLFPADIAAALDEVPEPRVLVSTPRHLRAMVE
jgi:acyl-coenzyme A synthetase/AMP-(fatty) acid ligase